MNSINGPAANVHSAATLEMNGMSGKGVNALSAAGLGMKCIIGRGVSARHVGVLVMSNTSGKTDANVKYVERLGKKGTTGKTIARDVRYAESQEIGNMQ